MAKFDRRAEWIWRRRGLGEMSFSTSSPRLAEETNRYVYFRFIFDVVGDVTEADAKVSADGRYQLFANGHFVGRGPARSNPSWQSMDCYDLAPYLHQGRNVIAALVHSYGRHTAWYELPAWEQVRAFGCGGFFLQGDVIATYQTDVESTTIRLDTNGDWRYLMSNAWQQDVPAGSLGFIEIYDARLAPKQWNELEFDDSNWDTAEILRVPGRNYAGDVIPFPVMINRPIPALKEELRQAEAVVRVAEVKNAPPASDIATLFEQETLSELTHCQIDNLSGLIQDDGCTITTTSTESVSLVFDFGETQPGRVRFDLEGSAGTVIDFTYSERLHDDDRVHMHKGIPGFDIYAAHRVILREGRQCWEAFELSGFRYLQVTIRQCENPLIIHSIELNFSAYPVQHRGQFSCSDDLLNRIWQVGANTLHHCMLDGYVDCPSREQRQWLDAYVDSLINYAAFGDPHLVANLLRQVAQSQQSDGITMMVAPGDFAVMRFTNIPDFCLYWILAIGTYLDYVGDLEIIEELYPSVVKAIGWFERHLNTDNLLTNVPHWVFVDWAELDKQGQVTALNAQFVAALRTAARLAHLVEAPRDKARFERLINEVSTAINHFLWDEERGVYIDARHNGVHSKRISQQTNAAVMAYNIAPVERWLRMFMTITDENRLVLTRFGTAQTESVIFDEMHNVVLAQPFFMHFLHRALCQTGHHQTMLDNIRQRWGAMLESGNRTFRESWQIIELTSLCHAWAGTPTFDMSTEILGIKPLEPGFKRFRVAPHPADLSWARGIFPTPHGDIEVDWHIDADHFELTVHVPPGTEAEVVIPESVNMSWSEVKLNDQVVTNINSIILSTTGTHHIFANELGDV